ncbi:hypothetical protein ABK040_011739 [Willaertia magna]
MPSNNNSSLPVVLSTCNIVPPKKRRVVCHQNAAVVVSNTNTITSLGVVVDNDNNHNTNDKKLVDSSKPSNKIQKTRKTSTNRYLPKEAIQILKNWLFNNWNNPYPTTDTKRELAQECGINLKQVNNYFINARRRICKKYTKGPPVKDNAFDNNTASSNNSLSQFYSTSTSEHNSIVLEEDKVLKEEKEVKNFISCIDHSILKQEPILFDDQEANCSMMLKKTADLFSSASEQHHSVLYDPLLFSFLEQEQYEAALSLAEMHNINM